jgi:AAA domain
MPRLHINQIQVTILTDGGKFGCAIKFDNGLNVIRAENTSGKSSCVNSILYALGLEALLGKQGRQAMSPALRTELEYDHRTYRVLESYVELDIENSNNEVVRIKRQVAGNQDDRLVTATHLASTSESKADSNYFFLRDPGAVQHEKGFHNFLSSFLGWKLPVVDTYSGAKVPLYPECIFPLFS